jgi:oxygen-independent coproporphyrinogen-3 oxidase
MGGLLACRHNLQYWRNQPYLGLGAGAHGWAGGVRTANVLAPAAYPTLPGWRSALPAHPGDAEANSIDQRARLPKP